MKILLVSEDVPAQALGGAGKHMVTLGNALIEAGHEVEMLGRCRAAGAVGNNDFLGTLHCDIDFRGSGWQEFRFGAFLPGRRRFAASLIWKAIKGLGADRFDVIHYHGHFYALGALIPASIKFVQSVHDQGSECMTMLRFKNGEVCSAQDPKDCAVCATPRPNWLQKQASALAVNALRRNSMRAYSKHDVIWVSDFVRTRFIQHAKPDSALRSNVIHNFIDQRAMTRALNSEARLASVAKPLLLLVGRVDQAKGILAFLDLLPEAAFQQFQVRVIGAGPDLAQARARHEPRGVEFLGSQAQAHVFMQTSHASICVVPSVWEEACATTVIEALALGRTVFALARGGVPELMRYQTDRGRLELFQQLEDLIAALPQHAHSSPPSLVADDAADVRNRLPDILEVYQRAK